MLGIDKLPVHLCSAQPFGTTIDVGIYAVSSSGALRQVGNLIRFNLFDPVNPVIAAIFGISPLDVTDIPPIGTQIPAGLTAILPINLHDFTEALVYVRDNAFLRLRFAVSVNLPSVLPPLDSATVITVPGTLPLRFSQFGTFARVVQTSKFSEHF